MIIRERQNSFIVIKQEDHAQLSGRIAEGWKDKYIPADYKINDVVTAVHHHDRAWRELDSAPFYNDQKQKPYSFIDFPVAVKLVHYKHGIDIVQSENKYAALLHSLHYCSLIGGRNENEQHFLQNETRRQKHLKSSLQLFHRENEEALKAHLHLLQLCDSLSLYVCMNEPGTEKVYRNNKDGFQNSDAFPFTMGKDITASWKNISELIMTPSPLEEPLDFILPYKEITKEALKTKGLFQAFTDGPLKEVPISLLS
ncbi:DUF3891 family protein [Alkalicoccus halolimnae]|uniref:DUF3891 family protein n=1 Tax=Alkalicoccus halolimnae TaxID=1667239 RepID=A0A5C7FD41_9BACI|nr:DUF3891 family protein [Alkalicoccus halolimnae]TXF87398.1 DUF3891 family protein [Alkalicoccus halolimnae]